ncbi:hypothetical protein [Emticicia fontis]
MALIVPILSTVFLVWIAIFGEESVTVPINWLIILPITVLTGAVVSYFVDSYFERDKRFLKIIDYYSEKDNGLYGFFGLLFFILLMSMPFIIPLCVLFFMGKL